MISVGRNLVSAESVTLVLAVLIASFSVGAIVLPDTYAREAKPWRVQVEIQDWFDLVVLVPILVLSAVGSRRGHRVARFVLGGALMYALYNLVIYAFAVHFNRFFLGYSAALGLSLLALILLLRSMSSAEVAVWFKPAAKVRFAAGVLMALAVLFGALWLLELVPASVRNHPPQTLLEVGLVTNPVHALDLSVTLPTLFIVGLMLWRFQPLGLLLGPMLLVFAIVTDAAIVAIIVYSLSQGVPGEMGVAVGIAFAAMVTLAALVILLRGLSSKTSGAGSHERGASAAR